MPTRSLKDHSLPALREHFHEGGIPRYRANQIAVVEIVNFGVAFITQLVHAEQKLDRAGAVPQIGECGLPVSPARKESARHAHGVPLERLDALVNLTGKVRAVVLRESVGVRTPLAEPRPLLSPLADEIALVGLPHVSPIAPPS